MDKRSREQHRTSARQRRGLWQESPTHRNSLEDANFVGGQEGARKARERREASREAEPLKIATTSTGLQHHLLKEEGRCGVLANTTMKLYFLLFNLL